MNALIRTIETLLPQAMAAERYVLQRRLQRLQQRRLPALRKLPALRQLEVRLQASVERKARRQANLPRVDTNPDLPIAARKDDIIEAIRRHPVTVISGETGSGKTTQIPKFCLAAGRGIEGLIGCTQPRRIAATSVARRIAEELGQDVGGAVGYKIRFTDRTSPEAFIKIMTDGILLAEAQSDRYLTAYDTLIVDEAHERSLNIDFVLGILKTLLTHRADLKLIITSATIDTEKFSRAFDNAPIIEVSGRMYPVDVRYCPAETAEMQNGEPTHVDQAVAAVDQLLTESPGGDVLVFMPTEQDIRYCCELIEALDPKNVHVMPLFARLSASDQSRVFARMPRRKIIVATNIAETSLTIPGIKYVVDSGLARIPSYAPRSRTTSLPVVPISRSSADQRKGRCGRMQHGVCIRLYTEEDYETRPLYTAPEIQRANLAEVILRMIALRLGDVSRFPFIDPPDSRSIADGYRLLFELGAIEIKAGRRTASRAPQVDLEVKASDGRQTESDRSSMIAAQPLRVPGRFDRVVLTETGRLMARIPLDPRLSRMLIEAGQRGCTDEIAVIAAALSIQDPRERPADKTQAADRAHAAFIHSHSDFLTLLKIWQAYQTTWQEVQRTGAMKRFCRDNFLSFNRMREWWDIYTQVTDLMQECGLSRSDRSSVLSAVWNEVLPETSLYQAVHKSILSGLLSHLAVKKEKNLYRTAKGSEAMIFPGSALFNQGPTWLVAAELVETTRRFARTAASIDNAWLEELGAHLCRRTYLEPRWDQRRGEVVATEQVSLFGIVIVEGRTVSYGRINPEQACDIFIRHALVRGEVQKPLGFMRHNSRLVAEIQDLEHRLRRRDLLVGEDEMAAFYRQRLEGICDIRSLTAGLKKKGGDHFLQMTREDLLLYDPGQEELLKYPDRIEMGPHSFDCRYRFDPGQADDGITVTVPSALAAGVPAERLDWLVPGLYPEKIATLIKGLPKQYRKQLVPVNDTVEIVAREMPMSRGVLIRDLSDFIQRRFHVDIPAAVWLQIQLPDHLKMRLSVTGPDGCELCSGRDPALLQRKAARRTREPEELAELRRRWERSGIVRWDFGDLPEAVAVQTNGWVFYPALVSQEQDIHLRLFQRQDEAAAAHISGVAALYAVHFARDLKFLKKYLKLPRAFKPAVDCFGGAGPVEQSAYQRIVRQLFGRNIRLRTDFYDYAESVAARILPSAQDLMTRLKAVLTAYYETRALLADLRRSSRDNPRTRALFDELAAELTRLVPVDFVKLYEPGRLPHLERYLKAAAVRAERALVDLDKDRAKAQQIAPFTERLTSLLGELSPAASAEKRQAVEDFFWLLEEYKVSVFAQELKTAATVSRKRLETVLKQIEKMI
jgi:ATP-dependent helicase HrpA